MRTRDLKRDEIHPDERAAAQRLNAIVLYACSGSHGHRVLAENYRDLLHSIGIDAIAVDVFTQEGRERFNVWISVYFRLLRVAPKLWRYLYSGWTRLPGIDFIRRWVMPRRFKKTQALLLSATPDLVLSTHPISTAVADFLKAREELVAPLWVAISDWHIQSFWVFPHVGRYLVPVPTQVETLKKSGVAAEIVTVVGMLLSQDYYTQVKTRDAAREELRINKSSKVVLITGGGKGWALEQIIEGTRNVQAECIVIAGSEKRKRELQRYLRKKKYVGDWTILGWVDPMSYLLASDLVVAKPGGLTTAEVLHLNKPLILCEAMPGHEEENGRVLNEIGVSWTQNVEELESLISNFFNHGYLNVRSGLLDQNQCSNKSPQLVRQVLNQVFALGIQ
jgi:processive 1,2-diacylglycerol beta-glucosyltransferase